MTDIKFKGKPRKHLDTTGWLQSKDGHQYWTSAYNYALQREIEDNKKDTEARSCFQACRTCGHCKASRRGCGAPFSYDSNAGKTIYCEGCEKFGFCDCANGFLRNTRGEAEPFTEEAQKLFDAGGKPLI